MFITIKKILIAIGLLAIASPVFSAGLPPLRSDINGQNDLSVCTIINLSGSGVTRTMAGTRATYTISSSGSSGGDFSGLTLAGDSGSEALTNSDTITIAGGTNITTEAAATDTVTVNLDDDITVDTINARDPDTFITLDNLTPTSTLITELGLADYELNANLTDDVNQITLASGFITADDLTPTATLETELNHDNLTGFDPNEHILPQNMTTVGTIAVGVWNGTDIDFSDKTNATAGWGIVFTDDAISLSPNVTVGCLTAEVDGSTTNELDKTFNTVVVAGQDNVVADQLTDSLTLVAGTGMTITTSAGGDEVTFASTAGWVKTNEGSYLSGDATINGSLSVSNNLTVATINQVNPSTGYTLDFVSGQGATTDNNLTISGAGVKTFAVQSTDHDRVGFYFVRAEVGDAFYDIFIGNDSGYTQFLKEPFTADEEVLMQFEDGTDELQIMAGDVTINKALSVHDLWVGSTKITGGGLLQDDGAITYLISTTDDFAIGGTDTTSAAVYMDVSEGDLSVSNQLTVGANVYANSLKGTGTGDMVVAGSAVFNNNLTVIGDLSLNSNASASGSDYFVLMDATGKITGRSALTYPTTDGAGTGGSAAVGGTAAVQYADSTDLDGEANFNYVEATDLLNVNNVSISTGLTVTGDAWFNDTDLLVDGVITSTGNTYVIGDLSLNSNASATGSDYFVLMDANGKITGRSALTYPTTDGAGGEGGGLDNVVEDTTPQLGGELDCNGKSIMDATDSVDIKDDLSVSNSVSVTEALFVPNSGFIHGQKFSKTLAITNPTADKYFKGWRCPVAATITAVHLNCSGNVVVGQLWQFDSNGANGATVDATDITGIVDTNVDDDGSLSAASITAGNYVGWHTTSVTGTPTYAYITYEGYYN